MVIGVWVGIVRELLEDAGSEGDPDLPALLDAAVFKAPDSADEGRTSHSFEQLLTELQEEGKFDRQNILNQLDKMIPQAGPEARKVVQERGEFEIFSALPIKIRTKIWKYASRPDGDFTLFSGLFRYIDTVRDISNRRYIRF